MRKLTWHHVRPELSALHNHHSLPMDFQPLSCRMPPHRLSHQSCAQRRGRLCVRLAPAQFVAGAH